MTINPAFGSLGSAAFCLQSTGANEPKPWTKRTITCRFHGPVDAPLRTIIEGAATAWTSKETISIEWVADDRPADIRIALQAGPTRCALGSDAAAIPQDQPTAVLGWKTWKGDKVIHTHDNMRAMARHMWGHVLGL
jgi:hypothetical protein